MPLVAAWSTPQIEIQEVTAGNVFGGFESNGTLDTISVGAPYYSGRVKFFGGGTKGGLFSVAPDNQGLSIAGIQFVGPGTTDVMILIQQQLFPAAVPVQQSYLFFEASKIGYQDGIGGATATLNPESFVYYFRTPIFLLPGARANVISTGVLTSAGRCSIIYGNGWGVPPLASID